MALRSQSEAMHVYKKDILAVNKYLQLPPLSKKVQTFRLNKRQVWVLSVIQYIVNRCHRLWGTIDDTLYYMVPASDKQKVSFKDFLKMLEFYGYDRRSFVHRNPKTNYVFDERELILFLRNCTSEMQRFYLNICSRQKALYVFFKYNNRLGDHLNDIYPMLDDAEWRRRMGKKSRDKGKRGQNEFKSLLTQRGWTFMESRAGAEEEDVLGISPEGRVYAIEVKNCININQTAFLKQAKEQAQKRGKHVGWMLACSVYGFAKTFLVVTATSCELWQEVK